MFSTLLLVVLVNGIFSVHYNLSCNLVPGCGCVRRLTRPSVHLLCTRAVSPLLAKDAAGTPEVPAPVVHEGGRAMLPHNLIAGIGKETDTDTDIPTHSTTETEMKTKTNRDGRGRGREREREREREGEGETAKDT